MSVLTNKGKVVYRRKKHYMGVLDVVRSLEALSVRLTKAELSKNPYACNALFEIVRTAFYPTWQRAICSRAPTEEDKGFYAIVENQLRVEWKNITFDVCRRIGEEFEIPGSIIDFVMEYFANVIWNVVWSITDPFFKN